MKDEITQSFLIGNNFNTHSTVCTILIDNIFNVKGIVLIILNLKGQKYSS